MQIMILTATTRPRPQTNGRTRSPICTGFWSLKKVTTQNDPGRSMSCKVRCAGGWLMLENALIGTGDRDAIKLWFHHICIEWNVPGSQCPLAWVEKVRTAKCHGLPEIKENIMKLYNGDCYSSHSGSNISKDLWAGVGTRISFELCSFIRSASRQEPQQTSNTFLWGIASKRGTHTKRDIRHIYGSRDFQWQNFDLHSVAKKAEGWG